MGAEGRDRGLRARVHFSSSPSHPSEDNSSSGVPDQEANACERGPSISGQEGNLPSTPSPGGGVLVGILSHAQEIRRLAPDFEPQAAQCVHPSEAISDGDAGVGSTVSYQGQVDHVARLEGRVLARAYSTGGPEMAPLRTRRAGISVPLPPVRPINGPEGVHVHRSVGGSVPEASWNLSDHVFGRLASSQSVRIAVTEGPAVRPSDDRGPRVHSERSKISLRTHTDSNVPGRSARPRQRDRRPVSRANSHPVSKRAGSSTDVEGSSTTLATGVGADGQYGRTSTVLPHANAGCPASLASSLPTQFGQYNQGCSDDSVDPAAPRLVAHAGQSRQGGDIFYLRLFLSKVIEIFI